MNLHRVDEQIRDAETALRFLKEGNERYVSGKLSPKNSYERDRELLRGGQKPFAIVMSCADSRVVPEIIFDQGLGDLFTIRVAGNVLDDAVLSSILLGVVDLHCPLMVVCTHTNCAAVKATMSEGGEDAEIAAPLIRYISKAVRPGEHPDMVSERNAIMTAELLRENALIKEKGMEVLPAIYDVESGKVHWL